MSVIASRSSRLPNTDKLFAYLKKEQWQNVSANFAGFVRKEYEATMTHLEEDEENFKNLRVMIEYAEVGRYNDAKTLLEPALKEFQELEDLLRDRDIFKSKPSPRRHAGGDTNAYDNRRQGYSPMKSTSPSPRNAINNVNNGKSRDIYSPNKGRDLYSPNKRESVPNTPKRPGSDGYGERRDLYSPGKRDGVTTPKRDGVTPTEGARQDGYTPGRYHEVSERSPRTPLKTPPPNQPRAYDDPHRLNYDSLRLKSPLNDDGPGREHSGKSDRGSHVAPTGFDQHASSKEVWGRNNNTKPSMGYNSTYKQEFPEHPVENYGRQDKNRYRENFGSAMENDYMHHLDGQPDYRDEFRETILVGNDVKIQIQSKHERLHRLQETPDNDKKPSDLARKFKEIYMNEWTDAYDEIVKDFGAEKTARHLLWIVTEAYLIAQEIADDQLRTLEQRSYSVMAGPHEEAWLISLEIGDKQLRDLEKSTYSIMSRPGSEHHQRSVHSRDLGEALPTSRNLLLKYRKQTSALSVPYVKEVNGIVVCSACISGALLCLLKTSHGDYACFELQIEECRDRICRTLLESSGFPKLYLSDASRVVAYILKCAEVVWMMSVQDPPVVLEYITKETEGARFNSEHYQPYSSPGAIYKFGVWPMLRLDKRGPIIAKGIAQGGQ